jgi:predicted transposase YdaD
VAQPGIPGLRRLKQENRKFEACLGYMARLCLNQRKKKGREEGRRQREGRRKGRVERGRKKVRHVEAGSKEQCLWN